MAGSTTASLVRHADALGDARAHTDRRTSGWKKRAFALPSLDFLTGIPNRIIKAFEQIAQWRDASERLLTVAVNISTKQLTAHRAVDLVKERIAFHRVSADMIDIEVMESCVMKQPEIAQAILRQISELGIKIALDVYGTAFSGLSHLKQFPISVVKIDRSFVRDIRNDSVDAMIVSSKISLCHNLGLTVVAEGIETKD